MLPSRGFELEAIGGTRRLSVDDVFAVMVIHRLDVDGVHAVVVVHPQTREDVQETAIASLPMLNWPGRQPGQTAARTVFPERTLLR